MTEPKRHRRGGLYFEDFTVGASIEHGLTRTVTQMDNMLFSNMTLNPQPLHIDAHFCATETEWGKPLMNSLFTLGLMIGISVNDTTVGTTIGNLGMTDVTFPAPLFDGEFEVVRASLVKERHLKLRLKAERGPYVEAIGFGLGARLAQASGSVHLAYRLDVNEYRGERSPQLILEHLQSTT